MLWSRQPRNVPSRLSLMYLLSNNGFKELAIIYYRGKHRAPMLYLTVVMIYPIVIMTTAPYEEEELLDIISETYTTWVLDLLLKETSPSGD